MAEIIDLKSRKRREATPRSSVGEDVTNAYRQTAQKRFPREQLCEKSRNLIESFFRQILSIKTALEGKRDQVLDILRNIDLRLYMGAITLDEFGVTPEQWKSLCELYRFHSFYALHAVSEIFGEKPMWKIQLNLAEGFEEYKFQMKLTPEISSQGEPIMIIETAIINITNGQEEILSREIELMWDKENRGAKSVPKVIQKVANTRKLRAYTKIQAGDALC